MLEAKKGFGKVKIKPRILIVDDEPQIGRVLRISLAARGYNVRIASDGAAALNVFGDWQPDLVITDLSMPNMDGLELCRNLRTHSQIPIIAISAASDKRARSEAQDAGADDFIAKPFGINELLVRVRALLAA